MVKVNKNDKEFINMLENTSAQRYLRATPFSTNDGVDFNGKLSEKMFFDEFYTDTPDAQMKKKVILQNIKNNNGSIIVLIGYSGCGKTTFIHYLLKEQKEKMYLFDFEKGINNQAKDPILSKLILSLNVQISDDIIYNHHKVLDIFKQIFFQTSYENHQLFDAYIDQDGKIGKFIDAFYEEKIFDEMINKIYKGHDDQNKIDMHRLLSAYLNSMDYLQTLGLFVLWDVAEDIHKNSMGTKDQIGGIFCFDNLDNIDDTNKQKLFVKHFAQSVINIREILKNLNLKEYGLNKGELVDKYSYIVSYRETTYAKLTEHLNDTVKFIYDEQIISELYIKRNIVERRFGFIERNKSHVPVELYNSVNSVNKLLKNRYIERNVFPLFNNSYNIAVKTTCKICEDNVKYINEYNRISDIQNKRFYRGANGMILRLFFNYFKSKHYFEKDLELMDLSDEKPTYKFSPARLILTYLNNNNSDGCLYDLYRYFDGIIDPKDITRIINKIYLLRFSDWRHLLTFNKYPPENSNGLQPQLDLYNEGKPILETRDKYATMEITCAGRVFLKTVCTHFEFYAARIFEDKCAPLFSIDNIKNGECKFKEIIKGVYEAVRDCIRRLKDLNNRIMRVKNYTMRDYYQSEVIYEDLNAPKSGRQFHGERIIFNHIGYINIYRQYLLSLKNIPNEKKVEYNKFIAEYILKYIELYKKPECLKSFVNEAVVKDLEQQAESVYEHPENFNILIETNVYGEYFK